MKLLSMGLLLFSLSINFLFAQNKTYVSKCGDFVDTIYWTRDDKYGQIRLQTKQSSEIHDYVLTNAFVTRSWKIQNKQEGTNLFISYKNNIYYFNGKYKFKPCNKEVKSKGYPWIQNIALSGGQLFLNNSKSVTYECFRPDNLSLYAMRISNAGSEQFNNKNVLKTVVSLTGLLSRFWSCVYYFDYKTKEFIEYKGVNGPPGTNETIITLVK